MCLLFLTLSPVVSHDLFTSVQGFAIKQPNTFSDHSQISAGSKLVQTSQIIITVFKRITTWSFHNSMSGQQNSLLPFILVILSLLHLFESTNFDLSSTNVENATNQFTNIMTEAAKRSLKLSSQKKSKRKPNTTKWFDYDCKTLRSLISCSK